MKAKSLVKTNPYIKNVKTRKKLVARSVKTSCGVEGIKSTTKTAKFKITKRKNKKIYTSVK